MSLSRRDFLKWSCLAGTAAAAACLGLDLKPSQAYAAGLRVHRARQSTTICPYCAVGCGLIAHSRAGRILYTEGDPEHPINQGSLCAKGAALYQMAVNPRRITSPRYRAPGSDEWQELSWERAMEMIARRFKKARDADFTHINAQGLTVNRTEAVAHVGSAALDNEECWALQAMMRAMGLVYIEHQARI